MEGEILCEYCDNKIENGATKCGICEAEVTQKYRDSILSPAKDVCVVPKESISVLKVKSTPSNVDNQTTSIDVAFEAQSNVIGENSVYEKDEEVKQHLIQNGESMWICSSCTFNNTLDLLSCSVCYKTRDNLVIAGQVQEHWICQSCRLENELSLMSCTKCHNEKDQEMKKEENNQHNELLGKSSLYNVSSQDDTKGNAQQQANEAPLKHRKASKSLFPRVQKDKRWVCKSKDCDKKNKSKYGTCKRCGIERPAVDEILSSEGQSSKADVVEKKKSQKRLSLNIFSKNRKTSITSNPYCMKREISVEANANICKKDEPYIRD